MASVQLADMPNTPIFTPTGRAIEILAFPNVQLLDVTGSLQVFASANDWAKQTNKRVPYRIKVVAQNSPLLTNSGLAILAEPLSGTSQALDTLVVAGGWGVHAACQEAALVNWLKRRAAFARRLVSVCTGAFLLGAAGLLKGRRVVTHWSECELLSRKFPATRVVIDPIFVRDGAVWTSAGVTAGIDLALALVEEDLGHAVAMTVARALVVFLKRPGGQAQFSRSLELQHSATEFDRLLGWMSENLASDLSVRVLANKAAMSERTFVRRYRSATGVTPARAVERLRVEAAQRFLLGSGLPIKRIARRCGFGSEETMRQSFQRLLAVAPSEFRSRFSAN
jgi:transcriptional regulator GlxA family with amidase domain